MTHLTEDMTADLAGRFQRAYSRGSSAAPFERLSSLRAYAAAGRTPIVDLPAWDPDEEAFTGDLSER
ncbi:hypothetical protein [Parvularcula maris]|uniref:Uncharacterized protein n=1 Tax=Parvularcula maris TaxID=2965077 RepID=A0A9X2RHN5_9PROT|nr:hypothetical protein [Parvularcula maris]MCQ8185115.1 hypothetical protein [Parvularcula maris]